MSKNIKLNETEYTGVSTVKLPTVDGGIASFKDTDEITTPSGTKTITSNGTHDVTNYASAVVNVASGDGESNNDKMVDILSRTVTALVETDFDGVINIGEYAFAGCRSLLSAILPTTIKKIGTNCFYNCDKIESIVLGEGITNIGFSAFMSCKALKSIEIPSTVTALNYSCFKSCTLLESVIYRGQAPNLQAELFSGCTSLSLLDFSNCTSVPTLADTTKVFANVPKNCEIRIPSALATAWQSDTNWSAWAFTNYVTV